jgi:glucose-1-phosphate adenylyltransferase
VIVEAGASVKNCILMQGTIVRAGSTLDSIITDKGVTITAGKSLCGDPAYPIYIAKQNII